MITIVGERREIEQFVRDLERFAHRPLHFPQEVSQILEFGGGGMQQVFDDLIFHAKFVVKTQEVMKRIGPAGEGYDKLSAEFTTNVEKTTALLKTLVKEAPETSKKHFVEQFFSLDQEAFGRLMKLLADLSWVKNWQVDGKPLPHEH